MELITYKIVTFVCFFGAFIYLIATVLFGILSAIKQLRWKRSDHHRTYAKWFYAITWVGVALAEIMTWFWKSNDPDRHGIIFWIHLPCAATSLILSTLLVRKKFSPYRLRSRGYHYFWGGFCAAVFIISFVLGNIMLYRY